MTLGVPGFLGFQLTDVSGFGKLKSEFQLTDVGDFGRPRSQDFNLPTSVTLGGVLVRGFYTLIQLYSNQLTDVGDFGSRDLVVHLQTVLLEKNYVLITLLKK